MLYEMLTGIVSDVMVISVSNCLTCSFIQTPFYANNHSDMYVRVLQDELQFPDDRVMDQDTKSLIRGVSQFDLALVDTMAYALVTAAATQP